MNGFAIPELEVLGRDLEAASRRAPGRRSWGRRALLGGALAVAVAVPAAATKPLWAPLVGGETPLPRQAPAELRSRVATGAVPSGERWELVAYRARLRGGAAGACLYFRLGGSGSGACRTASDHRLGLIEEPLGEGTLLHGLLANGVARVELTLAGGRHLVVVPHDHGLPAETGSRERDPLRVLVAQLDGGSVRGAVARDEAGRELARSGNPAPAPAATPVIYSPSYRRSP
jgi:hypothetical protein